ncbi:hypothetical protein A9Q93_09565 [Nonlabens dokdonensis]|uniref:Carboxypeptidase-like regulatory domain-containing protein n=1 Tax=Nonlabens dokdonensis TaxID=328515 RepID=A0A1Z8ASC0_9FLAO|nr:carboxypeptidase-like regulatory domain-containing protein [Nonlabens dokdonensis]OUS13048.1 hypothetical protein A9Q93_09565 [Nonlabens dokdonensis]
MKHYLVVFSFLVCSFCFSQRTITGTVSDTDDVLLGASVSVKGTSVNTVTDFDGNYSIIANEEDILIFSYTGYESQEILVGDQSVIDVKLITDLIICFFPYYYPNYIHKIYGFNYQTFGIQFQNNYDLIPWDISPTISYLTNFNKNSSFAVSLERRFDLSDEFHFTARLTAETSDFNDNQYHSYKMELQKSVNGFWESDFMDIQLITGYIDYDGSTSSDNLGYGLGFEKSVIYNLKIGTNFIHWQEFNEFNANASYTWRRWSISGNYKHLADYEEFQIGLGYNFYF